jgi:hypothetical protein
MATWGPWMEGREYECAACGVGPAYHDHADHAFVRQSEQCQRLIPGRNDLMLCSRDRGHAGRCSEVR